MSSYPHSVSAPVTPVRRRSSIVDKPSPYTPSSTASTPYTASPSSRHSVTSSTLTTPSSLKFSPNPLRHVKSTKSIADLTLNWRTRAQLNGIKVSVTEDEGSKEDFLLSPAFAPSFRRKSSQLSSPVSGSHHTSSACDVPSPETSDVKYTLGAFSGPRRRVVYDSPFSDISEDDETNDRPKSAFPSLRAFQDRSNSEGPLRSSPLQDTHSSCSVCDKEPSGSSRMIVLSPCSHIFCASCFTGTLNIVGEKSMSCMDCHSQVDSFHFALGLQFISPGITSPTALLGNPFEESAPACATGIPKFASTRRSVRDPVAVLRIDNVPWDVTPLAIKKFIKHPIVHAHVLLDAKGKTLSHAFVQLAHENARAALRSSQNAILGQGRRARAVTVTLSSQAELMAALYPQWRGGFDGCQPSLDGLDNEQVNEALQHGLISNAELNSLFNLITTPDSHFLKVPSLPFYSLISILSTFPSDVDSRIFWSGRLRDALFRVTLAALKQLAMRKDSEDAELWGQLVAVSINCRVFTGLQICKLQLVVDDMPGADVKTSVHIPVSTLEAPGRFDSLAEQFGLEPGVLAAILQSFA